MSTIGRKQLALTASVLAALALGGTACTGEGTDLDEVETIKSAITSGEPFYDTKSQCEVSTYPSDPYIVRMHCCPLGMAMVGIYNSGGGVFKCKAVPTPPLGSGRYLDRGTQNTVYSTDRKYFTTMHTCIQGDVMVGYHSNYGYLACQEAPGSGPQVLDMGTQDSMEFPDVVPYKPLMHVCPNPGAMNGILALQGILRPLTSGSELAIAAPRVLTRWTAPVLSGANERSSICTGARLSSAANAPSRRPSAR